MDNLARLVDLSVERIPENQPAAGVVMVLGKFGKDWQIHDAKASDYVWNEETKN